MTIEVRDERPEDYPAIEAVHRAAFESEDEPALAVDLRAIDGAFGLVATGADGASIGHVVFSPAIVRDDPRPVLALGPVGVLPAHQRHGVGIALIEAGLARCRAAGAVAVVVLGDPAYYPRFGFRPAETWGLRSRWDVPPGVMQAMELVPGVLEGPPGLIAYDPAFDRFD